MTSVTARYRLVVVLIHDVRGSSSYRPVPDWIPVNVVRDAQMRQARKLVVRVDEVSLVGARHLRCVEVGYTHHRRVAAAQKR